MRGHCQHCYDEGYQAGRDRGYVDGRTSKAAESDPKTFGPANQWVDLTDDVRGLYGLPSEAREILVVLQGGEILGVLDWRKGSDG